jgi:Flp pilus assembly protein TadD
VPAPPRSDASSASAALLRQSREARAEGSYAEAAGAIERALRLDPNNAELWIELGELHLAQGNSAQAGSMARKALTLTGGDRTLEARAERLLRAAGAG